MEAPTNDEYVQQIAAVLELALISQHPSTVYVYRAQSSIRGVNDY